MDTVCSAALSLALLSLLIFALILAILALRQSKRLQGNRWARIVLPVAVALDWVLLIVFGITRFSSFGRHHNITLVADVLLVLTLLLLIAVARFSASKWKLSIATFILLAFWFWTEQTVSSRNEGSMLSVSISMVRDRIGCPQGDWGEEVLHKMAVYAKRGHRDAAIHAGKIWTEAHPKGRFNERIFTSIGWLYLFKAQNDSRHADEYVRQAMQYRDRAYDTDNEWRKYDISAFASLAALTESAGDLSEKERCVQYGNAIKLLNLRTLMLKEKQDEISGRVVPVENGFTVEQVKCLSDETQAEIAQVKEKQQKYGCKE